MKAWNCEITSSAKHSLTDKIFQPASTQVDVDAFTVGQKIDLQCRGEMLSQSTTDWKITLKTEKEENTPSYYISGPQFIDETTLNLQIASYKVGEQTPEFILSGGGEEATLSTSKFEVISVLDKHDYKSSSQSQSASAQQPQQGPQPYPFIGPDKLSYPTLLWAILLLLALLVLLIGVKKWIHRYRFKRWLEDMQNKQLAQSPDKYFYKELRGIHRDKLFGVEGYTRLQNAYYTFLEHKFLFPVRSRSISDTTKFFVRKVRAPKPVLVHLKRNLLELKKISQKAKDLSADDMAAMSDTLRKNVDELYGIKGEKVK